MKTFEIVSSKTLNEMKTVLENEGGLQIYQDSSSYQVLEGKELLQTTIEVVDVAPVLYVHGNRGAELNDAENAIKVYEYLGVLNRTQAADQRLWATLTHTVFWEYCRQRWTGITGINYVLEHWFEKKGAGLGALRRNSISRLWWAAHLTVAPWDDNKEYEIFRDSNREIYTGILLSQQQIFFDVLERSYGSSPKIRICLLDALKSFLPEVTNKDDLSREVSKELRLVLKGRYLEALPVVNIKKIIHNLVEAEAEALVKKGT